MFITLDLTICKYSYKILMILLCLTAYYTFFCRAEEMNFKNMDLTELDQEKLIWLDGYPKQGDGGRCGIIYKGGVKDWSCNHEARYICKSGPTACTPPGTTIQLLSKTCHDFVINIS